MTKSLYSNGRIHNLMYENIITRYQLNNVRADLYKRSVKNILGLSGKAIYYHAHLENTLIDDSSRPMSIDHKSRYTAFQRGARRIL